MRNSGHNKNNNNNYRGRGRGAPKRSHMILPPYNLLEAYEDVIPNFSDYLLERVKEEQEHRHNWENSYLKLYHRSYRLGQFFGVVIALALALVCRDLVLAGYQNEATILGITGFAFLAVVTISTSRSRRFIRKPRQNVKRDYDKKPFQDGNA